MLTDKNLYREHIFNSKNEFFKQHGFYGTRRLYRFKNNYGLSLVNAPILHTYPFAWEAAVIRFDHSESDEASIVYNTELTDDVVVFGSDEDANAFIERAAALFDQ